MKESLLQIAQDKSLTVLAKNQTPSTVFNANSIDIYREYLQTNLPSDQDFSLIPDDDLILSYLLIYSTSQQASKHINWTVKQDGITLIDSVLTLTNSSNLSNFYEWDFPYSLLLNPSRTLTLSSDFPIESLFLIGKDCYLTSKTLSYGS